VRLNFHSLVGLAVGALTGCSSTADPPDSARSFLDADALQAALRQEVAASGAEVGLYYRSLAQAGDSILLSADLLRPLPSQVDVKSTFSSIVDGSAFELPAESDSDTTFYGRVGEQASISDLIDRMITWSSNLATNILIEVADPKRVTRTVRSFGADSMEVLRGVEDLKAFQAGLSNTTTARDLGNVMGAVATSDRFTEQSRDEMLGILERQHFRDNIPAGLPSGTRVANKTGWITGINHDAAVVFPDGAPPYVLVIMVRGHPAEDQGEALAAELSGMVWAFQTREPAER